MHLVQSRLTNFYSIIISFLNSYQNLKRLSKITLNNVSECLFIYRSQSFNRMAQLAKRWVSNILYACSNLTFGIIYINLDQSGLRTRPYRILELVLVLCYIRAIQTNVILIRHDQSFSQKVLVLDQSLYDQSWTRPFC